MPVPVLQRILRTFEWKIPDAVRTIVSVLSSPGGKKRENGRSSIRRNVKIAFFRNKKKNPMFYRWRRRRRLRYTIVFYRPDDFSFRVRCKFLHLRANRRRTVVFDGKKLIIVFYRHRKRRAQKKKKRVPGHFYSIILKKYIYKNRIAKLRLNDVDTS